MGRLYQFSDIHFGGELADAAFAAGAFARADPPDLILVTGDLTLNGRVGEFQAARAWLDGLPKPCLAMPGNHDTPYLNLPLRALVPFRRYARLIGPAFGEVWEGADAAVRTFNSARGAQPRLDWSKGAVDLEQARLIARELVEAKDRLRIVACHHPLVEAIGAPVTGGVRRGEAAAGIFASGKVDLILSGHVHNPFAVPLAVGDGCTYGIGAGTLSQRLRGTPASFNQVTWDAEAVTVTAMGWTGSRFEPWRTWGLPRRR